MDVYNSRTKEIFVIAKVAWLKSTFVSKYIIIVLTQFDT